MKVVNALFEKVNWQAEDPNTKSKQSPNQDYIQVDKLSIKLPIHI